MTKTTLILASASLLLASAFTAHAQTSTTTQTTSTTEKTTYRATDDFGPHAGEFEFTLGGGGASNTDFDNSLGGVNFSVGYFLSDTLEISARQSINYSNGAGDGEYDGATFVALDHHFGTGRLRPFVGVNVGALYGENTSDTWAAGIEGGLKFYVLPQTFIFGLVNYAWTFKEADDAADNFNDGALLWTVGVGFNL
jgi:hypothetical protein